jgi:hypothetical protein
MLTLGEVHTGLLQHSSSLPPDRAAHAVSLLLGERVRQSERPIAYALSPEVLTGVDCALASLSGARTRAVGTTMSRACLTGGHILQGSTYVRVVRSDANRRLPWSYYLSRPGFVEVIGRTDLRRADRDGQMVDDLARGFVIPEPPIGTLDLGAISGRVMDSVQFRAGPDRAPPFKMWRTRLRWAAVPTEESSESAEPRVRFTIEEGNVRTLTVMANVDSPTHVVELCEDLALHDWLLTSLLLILERSQIGALRRSEVVHRLAPAVDHLLHLWMPAVRINQSLLGVWESIERWPGFTRQWRSSVDRVRDQVSVSTLALYNAITELSAGSV